MNGVCMCLDRCWVDDTNVTAEFLAGNILVIMRHFLVQPLQMLYFVSCLPSFVKRARVVGLHAGRSAMQVMQNYHLASRKGGERV